MAITRLSHHSSFINTDGRSIVRLCTRGGRQISAARITSGDIVGVRAHGHSNFHEGVVTTVDETSISINLDDPLEEDDENVLFFVLKLTSDVTHKRYTAALEALEVAYTDPTHVAHTLLQVLLDAREPRFTEEAGAIDEELLKRLNAKQKDAVMCALRAKDLAVIHGPPGTGKTHTVVVYVLAEVARENRVLVVAPSNVAVDNVVERLAGSGQKLKFVRAGHPARIIPNVAKYGLDAQLGKTEEAGLARDIRTELGDLEMRIAKTREKDEKRSLRAEQKELRKELRIREREAVKRLLANMDVVLATISGAGARVLDIAEDAMPFDVVVIDEAAQALEAACWVPLLRARKAVLAGDPFQLAATVKSATAEKRGLKESILDRIFATSSLKSCITMLCTQYRMNNVISNWSSKEFYEAKLIADSTVAEHRVVDLESCKEKVDDDQNLVNPFIVIDTAGGDCEEDELSDDVVQDANTNPSSIKTASRSNRGEAEIVARVVNEFITCGLYRREVAVISPYSGQVELLRRLLWPKHGKTLEIATVDSFQGREKEVVCMSLVRSNEQGEVGFLRDNRRLNVAITRARRCVVIVCDSETVSTQPLLLRMIEYAENFGHYRSAVTDFPDIVGTVSLQRRPNEAIEAEHRSTAKKKRRPKSKAAKSSLISDASESQQKYVSSGPPMDLSRKGNGHDVDLNDQLHDDIASFCEDDARTEKEFPVELSSLGRRLVHELAEKFRLGHETKNVVGGRQIRVWKPEMFNKERISSTDTTSIDQEPARTSEAITDSTRSGMFEILNNNDPEGIIEQESTTAISDEETMSQYNGINSVLKEATRAREARRSEVEQINTKDSTGLEELNVAGVHKASKKKKRQGKKTKPGDSSDDDFDAVLAKYGAPQHMDGASSTTDLVRKIMEGKMVTTAAAPKVNMQAKQRLAAKLAQEAEKRNRKAKQK